MKAHGPLKAALETERMNAMKTANSPDRILKVDDMTFTALTAFFSRVDLDTLKNVLRRRYLSESFSEKQIDALCCALTLFYSEQLDSVTTQRLRDEFPEFIDCDPPF